jgi:hypothetical protein
MSAIILLRFEAPASFPYKRDLSSYGPVPETKDEHINAGICSIAAGSPAIPDKYCLACPGGQLLMGMVHQTHAA